jgi:hypothetical protein
MATRATAALPGDQRLLLTDLVLAVYVLGPITRSTPRALPN